MAANIRDVARAAKVSTATVSRVLNNPATVSDGTKKTVETAIRQLDYKPPVFAKALTKRSLMTIGVIIPDITNLYYPTVVKVLENELWSQDFNIFLCNTEESIEREKSYISTLLRKGVDGMIFLGTRPASTRDSHIAELSEKLPVLLVNDYVLGSNVYSVMADEVEGSYKAIRYLISLGHKKIAFINGNVDYTTWKYKRTGYEKALIDSNLEVHPEWIVEEDPHEEGGYQAANRVLQLANRPTAIFAASDQIATGVMRACYEQRLTIPKDLSLVGFSNVPIASTLYPALTTVDQFPAKTAKIAAKMIVQLIRKEGLDQRRIILEPELVIRSSCASISDLKI